MNPSLAMHDLEKQTKLQIDISDKTIKLMVFKQKKPLDHYSRKLIPAETNYTTGNKTMFAMVITLKHWRYLILKN